MKEAIIALISVLLGGAITLATQALSHRREDQRDSAAKRDREVERISGLYEVALYRLDKNARNLGRGDAKDLNSTVRILSRIRLVATPEILRQYLKTADALDAWSDEARQGAPKPFAPGVVMISSNDPTHQAKADALFPEFSDGFERLRAMMREHLESLKQSK